MFHIVLFNPEIPPNTGNAIRLCANTGCTLHLVRPLGFDMGHAALRRAGLDYAELATVRVHPSLQDCLSALPPARLFAIETSGTRAYSEAEFTPGDVLLFGGERRGLPPEVLATVPADRRLLIPMRGGNRSLQRRRARRVRGLAPERVCYSVSGLMGRLISSRTASRAGTFSYSTR